MKFSKPTLILIVIVVVGIAGIACKLYDLGYLSIPGQRIDIYSQMPSFEAIERSGKVFDEKQMKGDVWMVDFIFTRCAGQCPTMSLAMQRLLKNYPKLRALSFTTDPDYDSPQVLATYAQWYEADARRWLFVTTDKTQLNRVTTTIKLASADDPALHSNYFVLVDKKGRIRGYFDPNDAQQLLKLEKALKAIL